MRQGGGRLGYTVYGSLRRGKCVIRPPAEVCNGASVIVQADADTIEVASSP